MRVRGEEAWFDLVGLEKGVWGLRNWIGDNR